MDVVLYGMGRLPPTLRGVLENTAIGAQIVDALGYGEVMETISSELNNVTFPPKEIPEERRRSLEYGEHH